MSRKPVVIYHSGCADGMAAAWCFWRQYGDEYEYYPGVYGNPTPDIVDRDVYLVDFSYKRDVIEVMLDFAKSITVLDHHVSALDDLWDLAKVPNFDISHSSLHKSGARIAWDYVKAKEKHSYKAPQVLLHIEDRDLWKFELPHTREIMSAVFSYEMTFECYGNLMCLGKSGIRQLIKEGIVIERKFKKDLLSIVYSCTRPINIAGHDILVANANGFYASDLGNLLAQNRPFSATYYDTAEHRVFSLRSIKDEGIDVSQIAQLFGGGGHKNAAGFKVDRNHPLAKV